MKPPRILLPALARQLGLPTGAIGRLVMARMLNKANRPMVTPTVEALQLRPGDTGADIGFGGGLALELLLERVGPAGRVIGVDFSPDMVRRAAARYPDTRLQVYQGSITELPLGDATLDGVSCTNTIYFVDDLERAFAEVARVLAPTGRFALGIGDPELMRKMPVTAHGFRIRPVDEVLAALEAGGLTVKEHRKVGSTERFFHVILSARS